MGAVALAVALLAATAPRPGAAAEPRFPFPQNVAYAAGSLTPGQRPLDQLDAEVAAAYWRWKASYLAQAGTEADGQPRYRVKLGTASSEATVSEGQGFGMIIVALMAGEEPEAQRVFDGMWEFVADHPSENDSRLMDWHVPANEAPEPGDDGSAFDGDCDIAYALLLAEQQWGNGERIDYRARADEMLAGILGSTIGPDSHLPLLGDWAAPDDPTYGQYATRPSDFMPDHFRAFARLTGDSAWSQVVVAVQQVVETIQTVHSPTTGLVPDFVVPVSDSDHTPRPAPPDFLEGPHDGHYYYNAGRVPWRLGLDALLSGDPVSAAQVVRMSQWVRQAAAGDPLQVMAGYELNGTPIGDYFSTFFTAPFGVAAMLEPDGQAWLEAVWDAVVDVEEGYYEDSVTLLALLVMSHGWWDPSRPPEDCEPPTTPGGIQTSAATVSSGTAYTVSWNAAATADSYEIQEATDPSFADAATTTTSQLEATFQHTVTADTTYHYRVRSVRGCGSASTWSGSVAVTVTAAPSCTAYRYLVAGVASNPGAAGTNWKSFLSLANPGQGAVVASLVYRHDAGSAGVSASVPAGGVVGWDDVVSQLFVVTPPSAGAVEVCADHEIVVQARTYNDTPNGTYGQFLPGVSPAELIGPTATGLLGQLRGSAGFRTNVGFVNPGSEACQVRVTLHGPDGSALGSPVSATVPAGSWHQVNDVFDRADADETDLATATVEVLTAGGLVWAYGSVIDGASGDPTTIPMAVAAGSS